MQALGSVSALGGTFRPPAPAPRRRACAAPRARAMAGGTTVTVVYRTQWEQCELHYSDASGAFGSAFSKPERLRNV